MPINKNIIEGPDWGGMLESKISGAETAVGVKSEEKAESEGEACFAVVMSDPNYWKAPTVEELRDWKEQNKVELEHACFGR